MAYQNDELEATTQTTAHSEQTEDVQEKEEGETVRETVGGNNYLYSVIRYELASW